MSKTTTSKSTRSLPSNSDTPHDWRTRIELPWFHFTPPYPSNHSQEKGKPTKMFSKHREQNPETDHSILTKLHQFGCFIFSPWKSEWYESPCTHWTDSFYYIYIFFSLSLNPHRFIPPLIYMCPVILFNKEKVRNTAKFKRGKEW